MCSNYDKGNLGEQAVQEAFTKLGFEVKPHRAEDKGADLLSIRYDKIIVGEILNWYSSEKSYIHPARFDSIIKSLLSYEEADEYWLFACGVKPTKQQRRTLKMLGINLMCLDTIKRISTWTISNIVALLQGESKSVITYVSKSIDSYSKLCFEGFLFQEKVFHKPFESENSLSHFNSATFLITCGTRVGASGT